MPIDPALRFGVLPSDHVPDLLKPGLKLVFCGTALGRVSAARKAYYANPGNFFWRTLYDTGLTAEQIRPEDYKRLFDYDIGLTDLSKTHFGNDNQLPAGALDRDALREKIEHFQPRILAFTSKTGAGVFLGKPTGELSLGLQSERVGRTSLYVLPSPSGQARIFWDQAAWQALADAVA